LYGKERVGFDVSNGTIYGFNTNFDISKENNSLILGIGYVGRQDEVVDESTNLDELTHAVSGRINYAKNNIYANVEAVLKSKDALAEQGVVSEDKLFYGNALLIELGYSKKGLGISTSLRRLENMNFYTDRNAAGNEFNELIVNYLPSLTKQHDYSLANLYVYQAQSNLSITDSDNQQAGEIGFQTDVFFKIKKGTGLGGKYGTKVALNYSDWYGLKAKYVSVSDFQRAEVDFLGFGEIYYRDASMEVRKKLSKKTKTIFTYINNYYNKGVIVGGTEIVKSNTVIAEITQKFANKKSLRAEVQHLWTKDDHQNWAAGLAEFNFNTKLSIYATDMYNYGNDIKEDQNHYFTFGGSYTHKKSRFGLSYGRQRGGLICVGGVCRFVPAATGFTFSINTSF
jgi:ethanolamine utilization protein EutQ (cupin superfamily)